MLLMKCSHEPRPHRKKPAGFFYEVMVLESWGVVCYVKFMTPRMETFAKLIASDTSATITECYEKAGYSVHKTSTGAYDQKSYVNASKLATHPDIVNKINALKEQRERTQNAQKLRAMSREEKLKEDIVRELSQMSFSEEEASPNKLKALQLLGQTIGLYTERVVTKEEPLSEEELEREIKSDLDKWYPSNTKQ